MSVRALCDEFWTWRMLEYPELATAVGDHSSDHLWDDMSEAAIIKRKEFCSQFLARVKSATQVADSKDERDLGLLLTEELQTFISGLAHKCYVFALNGMEGPHIDHARTISWMKFDTVADYEKAIARLNSLHASIGQIVDLLKLGMAEGRMPSVVSMFRKNEMRCIARLTHQAVVIGLRSDLQLPVCTELHACSRSILDKARLALTWCDDFHRPCHGRVKLKQSTQRTTGVHDGVKELVCSVEDSAFFAPFKTFPSSVSESDRDLLRSKARSAIQDSVLPAFSQLAAFLMETYIPACRTDSVGCVDLPNGAQMYQDLLAFHTTTSLTPQEVHDIGLAEVKRILASMEQVMVEVGFAGSFQEFIAEMRSDAKFHYKSEEALLTAYKDACVQIHGLLPSIFQSVPDVECRIVETAAGANRVAPAAYYLAPSEDGSRPGTFYVNTYNLENRPSYELMALCLHECEPGHHFQSVFAMHQGEMPSFRRHVEDRLYYQAPGRFALHTAYMEGWGLYCESLGHELGLYDDPYMRFGRFSMEILRACRLVVDTGMHVLGWSRQRAIDYLAENSAMSMHNVTNEIDRFITWPGQACAYKIGELEIQKLRKEATEKLGSSFDVRDFHEVLLKCGPVPVQFFRSAVQEFIASRTSA